MKKVDLLNKYRKEADFINELYGLGDDDHDTALERGHIYELMRQFADHVIQSIDIVIVFDKISTSYYYGKDDWGNYNWGNDKDKAVYLFLDDAKQLNEKIKEHYDLSFIKV